MARPGCSVSAVAWFVLGALLTRGLLILEGSTSPALATFAAPSPSPTALSAATPPARTRSPAPGPGSEALTAAIERALSEGHRGYAAQLAKERDTVPDAPPAMVSRTAPPPPAAVPSPASHPPSDTAPDKSQRASCSGWGCRVSMGTFPDGPPYYRLTRACVGAGSLEFLAASVEEDAELRGLLRKCCGVDDLTNYTAARGKLQHAGCLGEGAPPPALLCTHNLNVYDTRMAFRTWNDTAAPHAVLPGDSLFLDTAVRDWHQFKHTTGRLVQYALLGRTFDHVLMPRVDHLPGEGRHVAKEGVTVRVFYNATVLPDVQRGATAVHLGGRSASPLCAETLYSVPNYEQMHFSRAQGERWRAILAERFSLPDSPCPPPTAALLRRMPGDGAQRGFTNDAVVDAVAAEFGISHVERISIGSRNSTAQHVALFNRVGILFTGHSSQLTNLVFAPRNAAVVEMVGNFIPWWKESPFQMGMEHIDVHYNVSRYHATNLTACGSLCWSGIDQNAAVTLQPHLLRAALREVVAAQLAVCPGLPWRLPPQEQTGYPAGGALMF